MEIRLTLIGQSGIENPKFDLLVNGSVIGSGEVLLSAKSAEGIYIASDTDPDPYMEKFVFQVPDALATPSGRVGIRFLNDYYDAEKVIDSNLYVVSVMVDGQTLDLRSASVLGANNEAREQVFWNDILVLPWYATASMGYSNVVPPETAENSNEAPADEGPALPDEAQSPIQEAVPICANPSSLVVEYPNGEATLSPDAKANLDALISNFGAGCSIVVRGYSSVGGPTEINLNVSKARALEVENYLRKRVPAGLSITSIGMGETDQFGDGAKNRRVILSVE